ncbi:RHS repeat-associated core domain-containing protein [Leifsonia sp. ALI-44-B]|uniref:RHS repeat-associated core domain-containing protein n=1 Tax=Leifsonia sp. ALI-44-B TaxID=1933776 RepID=UPI0015C3DCD9|nr:RHS repeat-associated core domain-containing protein [Leifsonia sp. ALI-44-B]
MKQTVAGGATSYVTSDPRTGQALGLTTGGGSMGMFLVDGIGNQVGSLTDAGSTAYCVFYAPYGAQTVTSGDTSDHWKQNPYGFKSGNRTDNGAIVKFEFRWYIAATGSWTQRDTLDAPLDPINGNRYAYAGSDPINETDPTGLAPNSCTVGMSVVTTLVGASWTAAGLLAPAGAGAAVAAIAGTVFTAGLTVASWYC